MVIFEGPDPPTPKLVDVLRHCAAIVLARCCLQPRRRLAHPGLMINGHDVGSDGKRQGASPGGPLDVTLSPAPYTTSPHGKGASTQFPPKNVLINIPVRRPVP